MPVVAVAVDSPLVLRAAQAAVEQAAVAEVITVLPAQQIPVEVVAVTEMHHITEKLADRA
jgi:hypothetical protein